MKINKAFAGFTRFVSKIAGEPLTFALSCFFLFVWVVCGPIFDYSDTWQLVVNTLTSIITFLMVFVIQNTQNRDGEAIQIKLDELIRANEKAHKSLLDLEELTEEQLAGIKKKYERLAARGRAQLAKGGKDTSSVDV